MPASYKNLIFTNHAYDRLKERSIAEDAIYEVINFADNQHPAGNNIKFIKTINHRKIYVVAKHLANDGKWLIISVWVRGEEDKVPLAWQLITLPFRAVWWSIKTVFKTIFTKKNN
jgi:uncharacterized protein DUF4258